jgi:hypothetical protein
VTNRKLSIMVSALGSRPLSSTCYLDWTLLSSTELLSPWMTLQQSRSVQREKVCCRPTGSVEGWATLIIALIDDDRTTLHSVLVCRPLLSAPSPCRRTVMGHSAGVPGTTNVHSSCTYLPKRQGSRLVFRYFGCFV